MSGRSAAKVSDWRRRTKEKLVEFHGGVCVDCGYSGPPFMYDFDHREPDKKEFSLSKKSCWSYERQLEETRKCDLVCANCHRFRTHRQNCAGCRYCVILG